MFEYLVDLRSLCNPKIYLLFGSCTSYSDYQLPNINGYSFGTGDTIGTDEKLLSKLTRFEHVSYLIAFGTTPFFQLAINLDT